MDLRWYVADGCRPTIEWFILFCVCVCVCHCIAKVLFVLVWCDDLLGAMHLHLILFREISISTWNKNEPFRFQFPDPVWRCRDLIKSSIDNLVWRIFCLSSMQMHMSHVLTARELVNRPINRIQSIGSAAVGECVCVCVCLCLRLSECKIYLTDYFTSIVLESRSNTANNGLRLAFFLFIVTLFSFFFFVFR